MPPRVKITKPDIIAASLETVRESGLLSLNARAVAKRLKCSTQPIFSNYSSMEELKADVIRSADEIYRGYLEAGMKSASHPPYKASGLAYIRFAREEKELFKLLFMRDRSREKTEEEKESLAPLLALLASAAGISLEQAYAFHIAMWIYVHGIAAMIATAYLDWDEETVSRLLTDAYQGLMARYKNREETTWMPS